MKISLQFVVCLIVSISVSNARAGEWNQFRGPLGDGHAPGSSLPVEWSEEKNITWKTSIHDRGWSSPVIWNNQIWLTTATDDGHNLYAVCIDQKTGDVIHDIPVFEVEKPQRIAAVNTYATPTPVIEEGRVYVHFGTYGTACIETSNGEILWTRRDLKCDHEDGAGPNSSPFLVDDLLVINVDGRDVQYVIALDKTSGETVWKTDRSVDYSKVPIHQRKAYTMPILVPRGDQKQLVSPGAQAIYSYDPLTGKELWKIRHRGWSIAPRPVFGNNLIYAVMDHDHPELWALATDGSGDLPENSIVWKETKGIPARSSPILVNDLLFVVNHAGILSCFESTSGKLVWKNRLSGKHSASPVYADNRIYFCNEKSVTTVIEPARQFKVLSENHLGKEELMASPAVSGNALFIRTDKHLYRIENAE